MVLTILTLLTKSCSQAIDPSAKGEPWQALAPGSIGPEALMLLEPFAILSKGYSKALLLLQRFALLSHGCSQATDADAKDCALSGLGARDARSSNSIGLPAPRPAQPWLRPGG